VAISNAYNPYSVARVQFSLKEPAVVVVKRGFDSAMVSSRRYQVEAA
jgi:hypothetical protein